MLLILLLLLELNVLLIDRDAARYGGLTVTVSYVLGKHSNEEGVYALFVTSQIITGPHQNKNKERVKKQVKEEKERELKKKNSLVLKNLGSLL